MLIYDRHLIRRTDRRTLHQGIGRVMHRIAWQKLCNHKRDNTETNFMNKYYRNNNGQLAVTSNTIQAATVAA